MGPFGGSGVTRPYDPELTKERGIRGLRGKHNIFFVVDFSVELYIC